jgi:phosphate transport system permease protein
MNREKAMNHKSYSPSPIRLVTMLICALPVAAVILVIVNIIWNSIPVIKIYGFGVLFSTTFSNSYSGVTIKGQYGLLPSLWGSVVLALSTILFAFPVSMALAIFGTEFSLKGTGRYIEVIMAIFSGIPPVVYSLLSIFVMVFFITPKLTGAGFPLDYLKSLPGVPPSNRLGPAETNTILGAIILSLLVIPFMTPFLLDAIKNVPQGLKEASYGLGATRWYTLTHVTLPSAANGILAALGTGMLKTIGDVVISAWTIGFGKNGMPNPFFDIFEAISPLTSTGASLMNGLTASPGTVIDPGQRSAAFFAALLLMILAFVILEAVSLAQKLVNRRFRQ